MCKRKGRIGAPEMLRARARRNTAKSQTNFQHNLHVIRNKLDLLGSSQVILGLAFNFTVQNREAAAKIDASFEDDLCMQLDLDLDLHVFVIRSAIHSFSESQWRLSF